MFKLPSTTKYFLPSLVHPPAGVRNIPFKDGIITFSVECPSVYDKEVAPENACAIEKTICVCET